MFHFILYTLLSINWILIAVAVVPAIFLMVKVYRTDRLDKESPALLRRLVVAGILSSLLALVEERIGVAVLNLFFPRHNSLLYNVLLYFVIVAVAEESSKYIFLRSRSWNDPEFNCQYDGVVYATFVSLGFALWENVQYVLTYGLSTGIVRAVTAIPGHASFGVFMGIFYGAAKRWDNAGVHSRSRTLRTVAVILPAVIHGAYDFIATIGEQSTMLPFTVFVGLLFLLSFRQVKAASKADRYIGRRPYGF